ncbi:MAG: (p)ppGpp synthetase [Eubacteriales bacterium]|nr:(p)ppGpp synthetase [Eubacteriales bacterium]
MTDTEYYNLIQPYRDAMKLLLTRLEVLNHTIYETAESKSIHMVQNRIKKKTSIENKLITRGEKPTKDNAKNMLMDIAGIRVVCYFIEDIDQLIHMLKNQSDLILIRESDYISNPKPNGYRSHHLIVGVNVFCLDASEYYPVEIQFRTISMDFWAALEHRISYKKQYDNKEQRVAELLRYSNILRDMEKEFEKYKD